MMSEKTENRLATFLAIIIAVFMAVTLNAQRTIYNDTTLTATQFVNLVQGDSNNPSREVIFNGNLTITAGQDISLNDACVGIKGKLFSTSNKDVTISLNKTKISLAQQSRKELWDNGFKKGVWNNGGKIREFKQSACGVSLPVEAIEFYYQDRGNGTGSFKLVVTDEYDIDKYRIVITDQDGIDIGYKWWYASEGTPKGLYRVYEIPVKLPTDCADIDFMYARVYKMEASTMEYEQVLNTISILNQ